jgi:hypothetical protein
MGRPFRIVELQIHIAVAEIRRHQVKPVEIGGLDRVVNRSRAPYQRLTTALDLGPHPE